MDPFQEEAGPMLRSLGRRRAARVSRCPVVSGDLAVSRRKRRFSSLVLVVALHLLAASAVARAGEGLTTAAWLDDLRFLEETIRSEHRNPFHSVDERDFDAAVAALRLEIPSLPDPLIVAGMARIVALLKDGHTRLTLPVNHEHLGFYQGHSIDPAPSPRVTPFLTLPVRFYLFSDGLHVRSAVTEQRHLLGAKVLRIGGMSSEQAFEAMRPFLAAENDSGLSFVAPSRLAVPDMLVAAGITEDRRITRVVLERPGDGPFEVVLDSLAADAVAVWHDAFEERANETPLYLRGNDSFYWFEVLPSAKAVYVQINQLDDNRSPPEPSGAFAARLFRTLEELGIERVIFDLRNNYGGDATYLRPFVLGLIRWPKIREPGHLFVLTGRKTFSAAILLVNELELYTHVTFVGEPIGGTPNHYGDSRRSQLPNSGLTLRTSTVYWREWTAFEDRPFFLNLPVGLSSKDYLAGRDPVLQTSLEYRPPADLTSNLIETDRLGGINQALFLLSRVKLDPATAEMSTEDAVNAFGYALLEQERPAHAAAIFTINREGYPESALAHAGECEAALALGDRERARRAYERAEALAPTEPRVLALRELLERSR